jgi:hypothetical protein
MKQETSVRQSFLLFATSCQSSASGRYCCFIIIFCDGRLCVIVITATTIGDDEKPSVNPPTTQHNKGSRMMAGEKEKI